MDTQTPARVPSYKLNQKLISAMRQARLIRSTCNNVVNMRGNCSNVHYSDNPNLANVTSAKFYLFK